MALLLLAQKAREWPLQCPLFILSADVRAAFDNLSPATVDNA